MTPTGRSIDLEKIREKLEKAKTLEEKRLIIEEVRSRRDRLWELYKSALYTVIGTVSSNGAICVATLVELYSRFMSHIYAIVVGVVVGLMVPLAVCMVVALRLGRQIRQIDDILLDPPMLPVGERLLITLFIIGMAFAVVTIVACLAGLGIVHI